MMVGGNLLGYTRVMTTTIALDTSRGDFELAIALGLVLILISFLMNGALHVLQGRVNP
jgi:tungstate transport system permease protein